MIVWLWDAAGPDVSMSGVSDTSEAARASAAYCMERKGAVTAYTEMATLVFGAEITYYTHSGTGWSAERDPQTGRVVEWKPFPEDVAAS